MDGPKGDERPDTDAVLPDNTAAAAEITMQIIRESYALFLHETKRAATAEAQEAARGLYEDFADNCVRFFSQSSAAQPDLHWFSGSDELRLYAQHSTIVFTYTDEAAKALRPPYLENLSKRLGTCATCARIYQSGRGKHLSSLAETLGVPTANLQVLNDSMDAYDVARLKSALQRLLSSSSENSPANVTAPVSGMGPLVVEAMFSETLLGDPANVRLLLELGVITQKHSDLEKLGQFSVSPMSIPLAFDNSIAASELGWRQLHTAPVDFWTPTRVQLIDSYVKALESEVTSSEAHRLRLTQAKMLRLLVKIPQARQLIANIFERQTQRVQGQRERDAICTLIEIVQLPRDHVQLDKVVDIIETALRSVQLTDVEPRLLAKLVHIFVTNLMNEFDSQSVQVAVRNLAMTFYESSGKGAKSAAMSLLTTALSLSPSSNHHLGKAADIKSLQVRTLVFDSALEISSTLLELGDESGSSASKFATVLMNYAVHQCLNTSEGSQVEVKKLELAVNVIRSSASHLLAKAVLAGLEYVAFVPEVYSSNEDPTALQTALTHLFVSMAPYEPFDGRPDTKKSLTALFLLTSVPSPSLSDAAHKCYSIEAAIGANPTQALSALVFAMEYVIAQSIVFLQPGLFALSTSALRQLRKTPIDTGDKPTGLMVDLVDVYLKRAWQFVATALQSLSSWPSAFSSSRHLEVAVALRQLFDFSQGLLDWNSELMSIPWVDLNLAHIPKRLSARIEPFAQKVPVLLQLSSEDLRFKGVTLNVDVLLFLKNNHLAIANTMLAQLDSLASGATKSKLSSDDFQRLSGALGRLDEGAGRRLMAAAQHTHPAPPMTPSQPQSQGYFQPASSTGTNGTTATLPKVGTTSPSKQRSLTDFFKLVTREDVPAPRPPRINNHIVEASAPKTLSKMEQIKQSLRETNTQSVGARALHAVSTKASNSREIHPARPAGFNPRKKEPEEGRAAPSHKSEDAFSDSSVSDNSDDSDPESAHGPLRALGKTKIRNIDSIQRGSVAAPGALRRAPPPINRVEIERRRMKQRLLVDLSELYKTMLTWEFYDTADYPKGFTADKIQVPDRFNSVEQYARIMEPLLHLEAWQGLKRAREEDDGKPFLLTLGKLSRVDDFVDVHASLPRTTFAEEHLNDSDILLLYFDGNKEPQEAVKPRRSYTHVLVKIKEGSIKYAAKGVVDFQLRTYQAEAIKPYLIPTRQIHAVRVMSVTTIEREYSALQALPYYDLLDNILRAEPAALAPPRPHVVAGYRKALDLNESQALAVHQAVTARGFSLIQGPPGTGKTKTIIATIGAFFTGGIGTKRLLVCAPSNAAVDEILSRLKQGLVDSNGKALDLRLVRLGRKEAMSDQVREFSLEEQVERSFSSKAEAPDSALAQKLDVLRRQRMEVIRELEDGESAMSGEKFSALTRKSEDLLTAIKEREKLLDAQRARLESVSRNKDAEYKKIQKEILSNCHVVCSTLSGSAHAQLAALEMAFSTVVIDEAAQSVELSALIPLRYGAQNCVMVGDPNQLPPTVLSQASANLKYDQSLFVRMFNQHRGKVSMLDTQFRMHPDIARFPSDEFYGGRLRNGPNMIEKTARPWHANALFPPFRFIDVHGSQERNNMQSWRNRTEVTLVVELVEELMATFRDIDFSGKIGVVSPYKQQVNDLRSTFIRRFDRDIVNRIDISSIDGFQGQEKDIIIFSCVRADTQSGSIGFLADIRRMNVGLTRARSSLWVLGNSKTLSRNKEWRRLVDMARSHDSWFAPGIRPGDIRGGRLNTNWKAASPQMSSHRTADLAAKIEGARAEAVPRVNGDTKPLFKVPAKREHTDLPYSEADEDARRSGTGRPVPSRETSVPLRAQGSNFSRDVNGPPRKRQDKNGGASFLRSTRRPNRRP